VLPAGCEDLGVRVCSGGCSRDLPVEGSATCWV